MKCPHCGRDIQGLGRKTMNLTVINVCDTLRACCSVPLTAKKLECSRGKIYKLLKQNNLTAKGVISGKMKKKEQK